MTIIMNFVIIFMVINFIVGAIIEKKPENASNYDMNNEIIMKSFQLFLIIEIIIKNIVIIRIIIVIIEVIYILIVIIIRQNTIT